MSQNSSGGNGSALVFGAVAATVGGLIWAGVVLVTEYEIGWLAWGIGWGVGAAMASRTMNRSPQLGISAATLAVVGLLIGKLLIFSSQLNSFADDVMEEEATLRAVVAMDMYTNGGFDKATQARLEALGEDDELPDDIAASVEQQIDNKLSGLNVDQRRELAAQFATNLGADLSYVDRIVAQLTPYDALWFGLAVFTAFGMMAKPQEAAA